jgi:hypothetical protein
MFNYSGRLFTFGCSFTNYHWPTWADILGKEFSYYENWGKVGAGNQYIFNSVVECNLRNKFTKNDTVIIMWTQTSREDRYINHKWESWTNWLGLDYLINPIDQRGFLIRDLASIDAVKSLLDLSRPSYHFLSMSPIVLNYADNNVVTDDVTKLYQQTINTISPSVYEIIFQSNWGSQTNRPSNNKEKILEQVDSVITKKIIQRLQEKYNELKGDDWPNFHQYLSGKFNVRTSYIKKELKDFDKIKKIFMLDIIRTITDQVNHLLEVTGHTNKNLIYPPGDYHPTPMEHLEYLLKSFPEWTPTSQLNDWVSIQNSHVLGENSLEFMLDWKSTPPTHRL